MDYRGSGGYMDTSFDGSSNSSNGHTRKPMGEQTMRALTIKQIKNCDIPQDGVFRVDGADVTQLTFIGIIRGVQELATNYVFTIEDGTGAIEVRKWVEQNESPLDAEARRELLVDTYVRVNGRLNSFGNRVTVVSHSIRRITDFNEISFHYLDAIHTHLTLVKPSTSTAYTSAMDIDSVAGKSVSIADRVTQTIQEYDDVPEGCNINQIIFKLKGLHTAEEIKETVEWLQNEGQCYTTIDNDHVKSCLP